MVEEIAFRKSAQRFIKGSRGREDYGTAKTEAS
jgi:hypothetical protein